MAKKVKATEETEKASKAQTWKHEAFARYIKKVTGYTPDLKTVSFVFLLLGKWRKSEDYQTEIKSRSKTSQPKATKKTATKKVAAKKSTKATPKKVAKKTVAKKVAPTKKKVKSVKIKKSKTDAAPVEDISDDESPFA